MSDIFICYSKADRAIATRLGQRLQEEGWSVFIDRHIDAGHRWSEEIESQLAAARAVLTLWSSSSLRSRFVLDEAHDAADRGIIFPARIEEVTIPYGFRQFQTPDLIGWDGVGDREEWQRIVAGLRKHLAGERGAANNSGAKTRRKTRRSTQTSTTTDNASDTSRQTTVGSGDVLHGDAVVTLKPAQSDPALVLAQRQTFRDRLNSGADGPLMVVIPAGRFRMGSPADEPERYGNEGPQHEVRIAAPFAMGVCEMTFEDYDRFGAHAKRRKAKDEGWGRGLRPVINVSWEDAQAYCAWLSGQTGRHYRLATEAEWEYACRGGTETPFDFGPRLTTDQANFDGNYTYNGSAKGKYRKQTVPVGSFPPNAFGLYDMHANVWECCQDTWHDNYEGHPTDLPLPLPSRSCNNPLSIGG
ncbi:MAG: SUMF1/EgtB/PvdO family nonheme iron enzyme [Gammaproteobacteria bacterium]